MEKVTIRQDANPVFRSDNQRTRFENKNGDKPVVIVRNVDSEAGSEGVLECVRDYIQAHTYVDDPVHPSGEKMTKSGKTETQYMGMNDVDVEPTQEGSVLVIIATDDMAGKFSEGIVEENASLYCEMSTVKKIRDMNASGQSQSEVPHFEPAS